MIDKLVKELAEIINDLIDKSYWDGLEDGEKGVDGQPQYEIDKNILTKALHQVREQTLEEVGEKFKLMIKFIPRKQDRDIITEAIEHTLQSLKEEK